MEAKDSPFACDLVPGCRVMALSLWEPWASLMAVGAKSIETRHWPTQYRGPLLIHAAKRRVKSELQDYLGDVDFQQGLADLVPGKPAIGPEDLGFGNALALVDLYDCRRTEAIADFEERAVRVEWPGESNTYLSLLEFEFGNYAPGRWGWMTRNVRRLKPFPLRGQQGLFEVVLPADLKNWEAP